MSKNPAVNPHVPVPIPQFEEAARQLELTPPAVRAAAKEMLLNKKLFDELGKDFESIGIAGETQLSTMLYLVGTSRVLPKPLAIMVQGPSSSGKSHVVERTALLFPDEGILIATDITANALYHRPPGELKHRYVVAGERSRIQTDEQAEKSRAWRELLSSGKLRKLSVQHDENNRLAAKDIVQEGPIAYAETTTLYAREVFPEDLNRMILFATDDTTEQNRRVLMAEGIRRAGSARSFVRPVIDKHHAMQRMLAATKPTVVIPFAPELAARFPGERVESRRAISQLLTVIEAVALLFAFQRERNAVDAITATLHDYGIAKQLMDAPLARTIGGRMSEGARHLHQKMSEAANVLDRTFVIRDLTSLAGRSENSIRNWISELSDEGYVRLTDPGYGPKPRVYTLTDKQMVAAHAMLPDGSSLAPSLVMLPGTSRELEDKPQTKSGPRVKNAIPKLVE